MTIIETYTQSRDTRHVDGVMFRCADCGHVKPVAKYEVFNAPNEWGMYEHFVPFVEKYLAACIDNPNAYVNVSR